MSTVWLYVALICLLLALTIVALLAADPDRRTDDGADEVDDDPAPVVDLRERLRPFVHDEDAS